MMLFSRGVAYMPVWVAGDIKMALIDFSISGFDFAGIDAATRCSAPDCTALSGGLARRLPSRERDIATALRAECLASAPEL
jgi:hypothetical protein